MKIAGFLLAGFALATAVPTKEHVNATSAHAHRRNLPEDWHLLGQAAGLSQQTYCFFQKYNQSVGDSELLYEYGDGNVKQRAAVFKSKSLGIAVAFEGTEPTSILSILHDANFELVNPDKELKTVFPQGVKVFKGFQEAYLDVASPILSKVKEYMAKYNESRVTVTGHSLGAAMALLASAHYAEELKQGVYRAFAFGLPRTGNPAFANAIDSKVGGKFYYVVNGKDWVPHMVPRDWGFQHPSGQIWIYPASSTNWSFYPGQENVHGANSIQPKWTFDDHHGNYFHTALGHGAGKCPAEVNTH